MHQENSGLRFLFWRTFCVQLNPETGLTLREGDQGHNSQTYEGKNNNEAPEII